MNKLSKELLAIFVVAFISFFIFKIWYNSMLDQSRHMQDIRRFDKIEEILKKGQTNSIDI